MITRPNQMGSSLKCREIVIFSLHEIILWFTHYFESYPCGKSDCNFFWDIWYSYISLFLLVSAYENSRFVYENEHHSTNYWKYMYIHWPISHTYSCLYSDRIQTRPSIYSNCILCTDNADFSVQNQLYFTDVLNETQWYTICSQWRKYSRIFSIENFKIVC